MRWLHLILIFLGLLLPARPGLAEGTDATSDSQAESPSLEERLATVDLLASTWLATQAAPAALPQPITTELNQLHQDYPKDPRPLQTLGRLATNSGHGQQAAQALNQALDLDPDNPETLWLLGGLSVKKAEISAAADYYGQAVQSPAARAVHHFDLATLLVLFRHDLTGQRFGPTSEAVLRTGLEHYRQAVELAPDQLEYARALAETYYILDPPDWQAARQAWFDVYQLAPTRHQTLLHLTRVCLRSERFHEAEWWLQQIDHPDATGLINRLLEKARDGQKTSSHPAP